MDNAAAYPSIAPAANGSCGASCYSVRATGSPRPATHWDATVLETVNPTATAKTWSLHIGNSFTDVPATNGFYRFVETTPARGRHRRLHGNPVLPGGGDDP